MVVDAGAANAAVGVPGRGIVLREPTAIMLQAHTTRILAIGDGAGRDPRALTRLCIKINKNKFALSFV